MKSMQRWLQILLVVLFVPVDAMASTGTVTRTKLEPRPSYSEIARRVATRLERDHVLQVKLDDWVAARAMERYLHMLDRSHAYFLEADIEKFRESEDKLDDMLKEGDVSIAYEIFEVLRERVAEREEFIDGALKRGFDLEKDESLLIDREDEPWPATGEERDDLWRRIVKNTYIGALLAAEQRKNKEGEDEEEGADEEEKLPEDVVRSRFRRYGKVINKAGPEWVLERYLTAFAMAYDPHCQYMAPRTMEDFKTRMNLSLVGIGAMLREQDDATAVVRIMPGGPADRDGRLKAGDRIVGIGQGTEPVVDVRHWPLSEVVHAIRGEKGSTIVLKVIPADEPAGEVTRKIDIVRGKVKLEGRAAKSEIVDVPGKSGKTNHYGVVILPSFYGTMGKPDSDSIAKPTSCSRDVAKILVELRSEGVDGVILDLRNNGGGSLPEAVKTVGIFIERGPAVLVRKAHSSIGMMPDDDPTMAYDGPLVVLVNRMSASASEIVAGALQDYGRAIIVGDSRTHGKGTVQTLLPLSRDEDAGMGTLKLTTALFYRISGSSTQLKGVTSDILAPSRLEFSETGEYSLRNALQWSMLRPVRFAPFADLGPVRRDLARMSEARRAEEEDYIAYTNQLHKVSMLIREHTVPLHIDKRREWARERRELSKLTSLREGDHSEPGKDFAREEALRVLGDLAREYGTLLIGHAVLLESGDHEEFLALRAEVDRLVQDLTSESSRVRSRARKNLKKLGEKARPHLEEYRSHRDPEVRMTIRKLLEK